MGYFIMCVLFIAQIFFIIQAMYGKYYKYAMILFVFTKMFILAMTILFMIISGNIKIGSIIYYLIDGLITIATPFIVKYIYNKRTK